MLDPTRKPTQESESVTLTIPYNEWRRILYALQMMEEHQRKVLVEGQGVTVAPSETGWVQEKPVEDSQPDEITSHTHTLEGWIPAGRNGRTLGEEGLVDPAVDPEETDVDTN
jgi:hypothetical protein